MNDANSIKMFLKTLNNYYRGKVTLQYRYLCSLLPYYVFSCKLTYCSSIPLTKITTKLILVCKSSCIMKVTKIRVAHFSNFTEKIWASTHQQ